MSYRIGSFNMRNFSLVAASNRDLDRIARMIDNDKNGLDIVALQEVLSDGNALPFLKKRLRGHWDYKCPRLDTPSKNYPYLGKDDRSESYAFFWNTDKFELVKDPEGESIEPEYWRNYKVKAGENRLMRDPLCGFFKVKSQNIEIRLITAHILYGKPENMKIELQGGAVAMRRNEFNILAGDIYSRIADNHLNTRCFVPYTILLGDYNLNLRSSGIGKDILPDVVCFDSKGRRLDGVIDGPRVIYTVQKEPTTVGKSGYVNNYDHFSYDKRVGDNIVKDVRRIDAAHEYAKAAGQTEETLFEDYFDNVSDHVPIVIEIDFK